MMHDEQEGGIMKYKGYCIDLMNELQKLLHFSYEIYEVPDGKYGGLTDNGTWNGMVGELVRGVSDMWHFCLGLFVMFHFDWVCDIPCLVSRQDRKKKRGSSDAEREFFSPKCHFIFWSQLFKLDSPNRWINPSPVDGAIGFPNTYPLDSEYLVDSAIQVFNNLGLTFSSLYIPSFDLSSINFVS